MQLFLIDELALVSLSTCFCRLVFVSPETPLQKIFKIAKVNALKQTPSRRLNRLSPQNRSWSSRERTDLIYIYRYSIKVEGVFDSSA